MTGLFLELGPLTLTRNATDQIEVQYSKDGWIKNGHLLFIDQPVGVGFSYTKNEKNYPTNEDGISVAFYIAIQKFLQLYPKTQGLKWYLSGESYAGRYLPAIGAYIFRQNAQPQQGNLKINLNGILIGNGLMFASVQRPARLETAYGVHILNQNDVKNLRTINRNCEEAIARNDTNAAIICDKILDYIGVVSGGVMSDDVRSIDDIDANDNMGVYLGQKEILPALHIESTPKNPAFNRSSAIVHDYMVHDIVESSLPDIDFVLSQTRLLIYGAQFDLIDGPLGTERWLRFLQAPYHTIVDVS
jgi:hypothetical protein